jgi:hypothetical protein
MTMTDPARIAIIAFALYSAPAHADRVTVEELDGNPFARLTVKNLCGTVGERLFEVETSRGPVIIRLVENGNGCWTAPDTFEVYDLPDGVSADPYQLDLTEDTPQNPGTIHLYEWVGN